MGIKDKIMTVANRIDNALGYFRICYGYDDKYRFIEESTNILISDINCLSSSIYNNNYRTYIRCLESIMKDGMIYLKRMNAFGLGQDKEHKNYLKQAYDFNLDWQPWDEEYKNVIIIFCKIGERKYLDNFNDDDLKFIYDKLEDMFLSLDRTCSLTGHNFIHYENNVIKQRQKINNVRIKADKGAIVQTGFGQSISNVNNRPN